MYVNQIELKKLKTNVLFALRNLPCKVGQVSAKAQDMGVKNGKTRLISNSGRIALRARKIAEGESLYLDCDIRIIIY